MTIPFTSALAALNRGQEVRRSDWRSKLRLDLNPETIWRVWPSGTETPWNPRQDDLLADDWEVVEWCDHGVTFDEAAWRADPSNVHSRWPRLDGECPKGCGFRGIAYASYTHYLAGDW